MDTSRRRNEQRRGFPRRADGTIVGRTVGDAAASIGAELLGYRVDELLGRGGMGVVYRAYDPKLKRAVAIKLLAPTLADDERFRERFLAETELAASLEHPNVVPIHDAGEDDGQLYLVMRFVEGGDLRRLLDAEAPLEPERAVAICSQVASALDAAHARGLVHRDVKPSNVLLDGDGHAYLADFGLTGSLGEDGGAPPLVFLGTPAYVAPEQIRGEPVDGRADLYSLGCLLHECLSGEAPFARDSDAAVLYAHLEDEPPEPPGLEGVTARALAKRPEERFESGRELVEAAADALGLTPRPARRSRHLLLAGAAVVLAALAAGVAGLALRGGSDAPEARGRVVAVDAASNDVRATVPAGDDPTAVAAGAERVWVASFRDGTLWQVDPVSLEATAIPTVGRPFDVTVWNRRAYVAGYNAQEGVPSANLGEYDAVVGGRLATVEQPVICSVASGQAGIWMAGCPSVQRLGRNPFRIVANVEIPVSARRTAATFREELTGIAVGDGAVWVLGDAADRRLWRIDPSSGDIVRTIDLPFAPRSVAAGAGGVWVTAQLDDTVSRIDPASGRITATVPVGRGAGAVAVGAGGIWVANTLGGTVTRIDPATSRVVATIDVGASPRDLAVSGDVVWVATKQD